MVVFASASTIYNYRIRYPKVFESIRWLELVLYYKHYYYVLNHVSFPFLWFCIYNNNIHVSSIYDYTNKTQKHTIFIYWTIHNKT